MSESMTSNCEWSLVALQVFMSRTTGQPKGVQIANSNLMSFKL